MDSDIETLRGILNSNVVGMAQHLVSGGRREGNEWKMLNPTRADHNIGSFSINTHTGAWNEFAHGHEKGGGVIDFWLYVTGSSFKDAIEDIKNAIEREKIEELRDNFKQVLKQLEETQRCRAS